MSATICPTRARWDRFEEYYQTVVRALDEFHTKQHAAHVWRWYEHVHVCQFGGHTGVTPIPAEAHAYVISKAS